MLYTGTDIRILSNSGGKDSNASGILAVKTGFHIDAVIYSEVMFDLKRGISGENPLHIEFIEHQVKPWYEGHGIPFFHLRSDRDFFYVFNHVNENPRVYPERRGMKNGFPLSSGGCPINRDCKERPRQNFYREHGLNLHNTVEIVGLASDEKKRLRSLYEKHPNAISLLDQYHVSEAEALKICEAEGLLSPTYHLLDMPVFSDNKEFWQKDISKKGVRGGCWFCPHCKRCEHKLVYDLMPDVFEEYVSLEDVPNIIYDRWNIRTSETLHDRLGLIKQFPSIF